MRSALATAAAIRAGETTARAECEAAIARIEALDPPLNAVVVRDFHRALTQADAADARVRAGEAAPLLGVPMTIKESFDIAGLPTTWGIEPFRDFVPDRDAVAVRRLKHAGAVFLGKTNVPVALADIQSVNPIYGRTNNAIDQGRVAGGSSGGGAVALASGMVPFEFGSDIGGSIRVPAAFNGVWGHKPTYGALPMEGHFLPGTDGAAVPMSVIGPLARDPDDLAIGLDIVADQPLPRATAKPVHHWRILVMGAHPLARAEASILAALDAVAEALGKAGARIDRTSDLLPDLELQHRHYMKLLNVTLSRRMPRDPSRPETTLEDWWELLDDQARNRRAWERLFGDYDAVIAPVLGHVAFAHDDTPLPARKVSIDGEETPAGAQFAYPGLATFPCLPATSVPIARDANDLPIGLQVIANTLQDHSAIAVARMAHLLTKELRGS